MNLLKRDIALRLGNFRSTIYGQYLPDKAQQLGDHSLASQSWTSAYIGRHLLLYWLNDQTTSYSQRQFRNRLQWRIIWHTINSVDSREATR